MNAAGNDFLFRRLDKIRVVGKSQPIRIFDLVDERHAMSEERKAFYQRFEEAMGVFEAREWAGAQAAFRGCLEISPDDGPSKTYLGRAENYAKNPPVADWDGVYNLTQK